MLHILRVLKLIIDLMIGGGVGGVGGGGGLPLLKIIDSGSVPAWISMERT